MSKQYPIINGYKKETVSGILIKLVIIVLFVATSFLFDSCMDVLCESFRVTEVTEVSSKKFKSAEVTEDLNKEVKISEAINTDLVNLILQGYSLVYEGNQITRLPLNFSQFAFLVNDIEKEIYLIKISN